MTEGIAGKVIVVTGASSGLGLAAARRLAKDGAKLVLGARRLDRLQALAAELGLPPEAAVATDVTDRAQVEALVARAIELHGRLDVIINNAGLMATSPLERLRVDEWDRMIDINIKGVLYGIAAALPHMTAQKNGQIVNVASVAAHKVRAASAVYAATKAAVRMLSEGLREGVKPYNIRTTVISPGAVATELPAGVADPETAKAVQGMYDQIAIPPDSFANVVAFAIAQPADVDINEIVYRPTAQEF